MELFEIRFDESYNLVVTLSPILLGLLLSFVIGIRIYRIKIGGEYYEINEAEIGIGSNKIKVRPNYDDMQIAYKLYVEWH
jgi:hypothetical protein